jgi:hypothetical protein
MALGARVRKLARLLLLGRDRGAATMCWVDPVVSIDPDGVAPGEFVASDCTVIEYSPPCSEAESRDRITSDEFDVGRVYAWDGREIGRCAVGSSDGLLRGRFLDFSWPADLPAISPARQLQLDEAAARGAAGHPSIVEQREIHRARIAAELADVEEKRIADVVRDLRGGL